MIGDLELGAAVGIALALFCVWMAAEVDKNMQHDIAPTHNVCMTIDQKGTLECIHGTEILELLRQKNH